MEFILTVIICSGTANTCLPPYAFPEPYPTIYECMIDGYGKSQEKIIEIGPKEVNKHRIYIKFECIDTTFLPQKPKVETWQD